MHTPDFWTSYGEAMELSVEGNTLIAREIAELTRVLWRRVLRAVGGVVNGAGQRRQLPRV